MHMCGRLFMAVWREQVHRHCCCLLQAMPGSAPLVAPPSPQPLLPKLARAAGALAVLAFGLALVLAPGQVLGNLLSTNAESIAGGAGWRGGSGQGSERGSTKPQSEEHIWQHCEDSDGGLLCAREAWSLFLPAASFFKCNRFTFIASLLKSSH
jgi:hypothetical protein